jgi:predicted RNase H-like nuclease (RuvC/YqgF family)
LIKVKDFLEKTVNKVTEENIALETLKNEMEARIGKLEGELKNLRSQMFNHKKIGREDLERQSIEVDSMKGELDNAIKR